MRRALACVLLFASPLLAAPADRTWKHTGDGATVVAATFLGGKGHEWLCGGGFAPDGSVVLVGNVLGPTFDLGTKAGVIGTDADQPKTDVARVPVLDKGQPKLDKEGKPVYERPSWKHDGGTAFVAVCSADLKTVKSVHRFPWLAGVATSAAVGPKGEIYVAGRATKNAEFIGKSYEEIEPTKDEAEGDGHAFVSKLTADGSKAEWVRHVHRKMAAPTVALAGGKVRFGAGKLFTLDDAGKLLAAVEVPGGLKVTSSVSPTDSSVVVGGEHNWPTGREPWRCPTLNVHAPDGKSFQQLYDWGGPLVGLDTLRQVSDSAVRLVTHEPDGSILFYAWSDGGNSVMTTEPMDVRAPTPHKGIGLTAAGAGVLSAAYIIRLDPKTLRTTAWTFWAANNGKPNSVWIDALATTPGGAVCVAGHGAADIWQTPDRLTEAGAFEDYVSVFGHDLTTLRYSSVIPGAGAAQVNDGTRRGTWGIVTGTVDGKDRVLFVGGATAGREENGKQVDTPTKNAGQDKFGGGWCDGYAVLLELPAGNAKPAEVTTAPRSVSFARAARPTDPKRVPADGTAFHFLPKYPAHVSAEAEFVDPSGERWPNFLSGKPLDGTFTYKEKGPECSLAFACSLVAQPQGDQSRRVLGGLLKDAKTGKEITDPAKDSPLVFRLTSLGAAKTADVEVPGKGGKAETKAVGYFDAAGVLTVGGKEVKVQPRVTVSYTGPKNADPDGVRLTAYLMLSGKDLGLADKPVEVRLTAHGTVRTEPPPKK